MFFSWFPLVFMGGSLSSLVNTVLTQTSCFLGNAFVSRPFSWYKQTWFHSLLCLGKASLTVCELCCWTRACSVQHSWKKMKQKLKWKTGPHCFPPSSDRTPVLPNSHTPKFIGMACPKKEYFWQKLQTGSSSECFWNGFVLIKLCLPSSGSILPWSIILVLLLQGTEQGIPSTQGHLESAFRADAPGICQQRKPKGSFEKSPEQCYNSSFCSEWDHDQGIDEFGELWNWDFWVLWCIKDIVAFPQWAMFFLYSEFFPPLWCFWLLKTRRQWECWVKFWVSACDSSVGFAVLCQAAVHTSLHQYPCDQYWGAQTNICSGRDHLKSP